MLKNCYQAKQLPALLEALQSKQVSGMFYLETMVGDRARKTNLTFKQGQLVYGGKLLTINEIVTLLKKNLGGEWISLAIESTLQQGGHQMTPQALLNRLVTMRLLSWEQVTAMCLSQIVIAIEPFLAYPGQFSFVPQIQPTIVDGFTIAQLMHAIYQRHPLWASLAPFIQDMEVVPYLSTKALHLLSNRQESVTESENTLLLQLLSWVDEKRSLFEIATMQERDPLLIARRLLPAFQNGWLVTQVEKKATIQAKPTILVVDNSDLMRQLLGRILGEQYRVLSATNAMEALSILNRKSIELMLLDISLPGIDGLELCRSIRNMTQFRTLPIFMVTARDGFFEKVKGRMAGATEYITKPFDSEQILQIVKKYLPVRATVAS
jgi:twitching motility two-component system response regulator PilG